MSYSICNDVLTPSIAFLVGVGGTVWWQRKQGPTSDDKNLNNSASVGKTIVVSNGLLSAAVLHDSDVTKDTSTSSSSDDSEASSTSLDLSVLPCIRHRRSIFPNSYWKNPPTPIDPSIIQSLLDAALWGPYHGKCYKGQGHPARFVVLGKQSMRDMQTLTLDYYDHNWQSHWNSLTEYQSWRERTQDEIEGRWGPVEYMMAIVMRRQAGPKRLPEWEEAAAVAAAVQNMHIQSTTTRFPQQLACYWSSWHDAARDSDEMKAFLGMMEEDKCMGFFMVAQAKPAVATSKDYRKRDRSLLQVEWRS